jgi:hypothetical protein
MGRSKPKQQSKSPNKRIEENDEQNLSMIITPQPATSRRETTEAEQSKTPDTKLYRPMNPTKDIYRDNASIQRHMDKLYRARIQQGLPPMYQCEDLPSATDTTEHVQQGNNGPTFTSGQGSPPIEEDKKMAAQASDNSAMERMFAKLAENTKIKMKQQEERHAKEIADIKQANRETRSIHKQNNHTKHHNYE